MTRFLKAPSNILHIKRKAGSTSSFSISLCAWTNRSVSSCHKGSCSDVPGNDLASMSSSVTNKKRQPGCVLTCSAKACKRSTEIRLRLVLISITKPELFLVAMISGW